MPTYNVTDPTTGLKVKLTGDSPPTEKELIEVFAQVGKNKPVAPKGMASIPIFNLSAD